MKLKKFYFENGWFGGYYIEDINGIAWPVFPTRRGAYKWYKRVEFGML